MTYPIAETFHSIQGEGTYAGTPMFFIRLAGCNVGKYTTASVAKGVGGFDESHPQLQDSNMVPVCTTALGQKFVCDTDYRKKLELDEHDLSAMIGSKQHVCITGGEPLLHDLLPLISAINNRKAETHIETSGTLPFPSYFRRFDDRVWITCSPKAGFLFCNANFVNEWKFVVDPKNFAAQESMIRQITFLVTSIAPVYISPVNLPNAVDSDNADFARQIVERNPDWRLCVQLHKILGVR